MLVTPKDKNIIGLKKYYINDNKLDDFVESLAKWKTGNSDPGLHIGLYKMRSILLVLDSAKRNIIINREQKYYRIYNGEDIFWGEQDDFEEV